MSRVDSEKNLRVTGTGKGWYDTISSDTGFEKGVHNWKVKVLKIHKDVVGCMCFGVISKTNWERKGQNKADFLWDDRAGASYFYYGKDNDACLRVGYQIVKSGIPCIYADEGIRIELNCEKRVIKFWKIKKGENSKEESLGELEIKEENVKWYPAMMGFAQYDADFRLIFD